MFTIKYNIDIIILYLTIIMFTYLFNYISNYLKKSNNEIIYPIYIAFIFNNYIIKWDELDSSCNINDVLILLKNKYKINKCILENNNVLFSNKQLLLKEMTNDKTIHGICLHVHTKNKNLIIPSD
jgi:hypothetical protein